MVKVEQTQIVTDKKKGKRKWKWVQLVTIKFLDFLFGNVSVGLTTKPNTKKNILKIKRKPIHRETIFQINDYPNSLNLIVTYKIPIKNSGRDTCSMLECTNAVVKCVFSVWIRVCDEIYVRDKTGNGHEMEHMNLLFP